LTRYLEHVSSSKRINSERRDRISAVALLGGFGQEISLASITPERLAVYRDARLKTVSPSTIQKEFALISHLFNIARKEWGVVDRQPGHRD